MYMKESLFTCQREMYNFSVVSGTSFGVFRVTEVWKFLRVGSIQPSSFLGFWPRSPSFLLTGCVVISLCATERPRQDTKVKGKSNRCQSKKRKSALIFLVPWEPSLLQIDFFDTTDGYFYIAIHLNIHYKMTSEFSKYTGALQVMELCSSL